jgi:PIN domain nuclease of toxin-antitoxin system
VYLLDSHILLWWLTEPEKLTRSEYAIIQNSAHEIFISSASIWEIAIKVSLKKLEVPEHLEEAILDLNFKILPIDFKIAWKVKDLPWHHSDPFDRLLIATAQQYELTLLTHDKVIHSYDLKILKNRTA